MKAWNSTLSAGKGFKSRTSPLKRSGTLRKIRPESVMTPNEAAKSRIQPLLRSIVMIRDKGCILRDKRCGAFMGDAGTIWQADHLISRGNASTFGDSRLVVLVCRGCHGWKSTGNNLRKAEYDRLVRSILPPERVKLWDLAEIEAGRHKGVKMDWTLVLLALQRELATLP